MSDPDSKEARKKLDGKLENVLDRTSFLAGEESDEDLDIENLEEITDDDLDKMMATLDSMIPVDQLKETGEAQVLGTPDVLINITEDELQASLIIDVPEGPHKRLDVEAIMQTLEKAGIIKGIDKTAVAELLARSEKEFHAEGVIATGEAPTPGEDGAIAWFIKMPPDNEEAADIFAAGTVVAKARPPKKGAPGESVMGEEIEASVGKPAELNHATGIRIDPKAGGWVTEIAGKVFQNEGKVTVIPFRNAKHTIEVINDGTVAKISIKRHEGKGRLISIDTIMDEIARRDIGGANRSTLEDAVKLSHEGKDVENCIFASSTLPEFTITVDATAMDATLLIEIPENPVRRFDSEYLQNSIKKQIESAGIVFGLDSVRVTELVAKALTETQIEGSIAKGQEAVNGADGEIRWLIDKPAAEKEEDAAPIIVAMGKMLAKLKPPLNGKAGQTVTGIELPAKAGVEPTLSVGRAVKYNRKFSAWIAKEQGRLTYVGTRLEIVPHRDEEFEIEIDENGLAAYLSIKPSKGKGKKIELETILGKIKRMGILRYEENTVNEMVENAIQGIEVRKGVIATGEPPYIETAVSVDGMEANVKVEMPSDPIREVPDEYLTHEIYDALKGANIVSGIDKDVIKEIVKSACEEGLGEGIAAKGVPAQDGKDGSIQWVVEQPE
ncbi:MAG: DUF342 domain-containing protein, partial [Candidatus Lindowbacteria bacterium]|nr:DUF342 domain-containing protein [Candidatus Lindowbacteria bacterium]